LGDSAAYKNERDELRRKFREYQLSKKAQSPAEADEALVAEPSTPSEETMKQNPAKAASANDPGNASAGTGDRQNNSNASVGGISINAPSNATASPHISVSPQITNSPHISAEPHATATAITGNHTQQQAVTLGINIHLGSSSEASAGSGSTAVTVRRGRRGISSIVVGFAAAASVAAGIYAWTQSPGAPTTPMAPPHSGANTGGSGSTGGGTAPPQRPSGADSAWRQDQNQKALHDDRQTSAEADAAATRDRDNRLEPLRKAGFTIKAGYTLRGLVVARSTTRTLEDCARLCTGPDCTGFTFHTVRLIASVIPGR
jgi:hypothetical protein